MYEDYSNLFATLSCTNNTITDSHQYPTENTSHWYPITSPPPPPLTLPANLESAEFNSVHDALVPIKSESSYDNSYGSPSSLPSYYAQRPSMFQRSLSNCSLEKDSFYHHQHHPIFSSIEEYHPEIFDMEESSMRKVFSTGDLQVNAVQRSCRSDSPTAQENCTIEGMNKVGRYNAEERKERIERYISKRNQRNFNKKIKYACRKTLADSRPRIRGRFARNDEMGESSQTQWSQNGGEENKEEEDDVWLKFFDAFSANLIQQ
ncbi:hypothetical protein GIB67_031807 [Kingdonia uniflora]|uniref:CCT domain-containing protein n=1 Tax=Kingdonia uniflora TaxID=39325 RepID=A0A7J7L4P6_9MAGN|nr:hypothetical protein GIB67_031807 [Kingdonia uniflora]